MKDQMELEATESVSAHDPNAALESPSPARWQTGLPSVTVGRLAALMPGTAPLVDFPTNNSGDLVPARTVVELNETQVGDDVALMFEDGEVTRPIIMGVLREWQTEPQQRLQRVRQAVTVQHDDDSLVLTAAKEITLQCGKASITLTSAGKVLLRGAYLLSRSSGVNRIKGGSVQIN